ncbi:endolytic transglycosylase MltG [Polaribacter sp. HL-MS24]|uniref:endolytic transglycosylase MltG n=1 Tax=Polaribacter sp. HL-MS24 TaxID=3077735 RepID=UPI0029345886|nr:endolytic transglycosylase MltG [Polaribacter sp. HL-MS24]WOC40486.1 endolytic transglycosylase MltG [Polaribacter sp. HL-MS24]
MNKKIVFITIATLVVISGIVFISFYKRIFSENVVLTGDLYIKSTDTMDELKKNISSFLENGESFDWVAKQKKFTNPKPGRYLLRKGMSNNDLVDLLRSGNQTPVKVTFNNQDTLEKFAKRISEQIEADSTQIIQAITNKTFLEKHHLNKKTVLGIFVPNRYEFYWTTSPENFRDRMLQEYHRFWNTHRLEKAQKLNLTQKDVITLASIVQKETAQISERPIVAGLYLNRLQKGWPLQADPTIIYCIREIKGQDFVVKRVLTTDLEIKSPFNTYKNRGLPPNLIAMPDRSAIDAVLNPAKHKYFYMCANTEKPGFHTFAKTLTQHNRNAAKYHRWMNQNGVNR